jgi:aspartyl-tRNA(Asn)/glutamyl-tRNA(Gln) amidotransferase subunit A
VDSIFETAELLRKRSVSPVELVRDCLARIEKLNSSLNAFITVTAELALEQARQAETEIQKGHWRGPLHGIPLGLKDLIDTAGIRTTAASAVFKDRVPEEDAEVARRLTAAGAILLGKQNLHEFAYGGSSIVSYFGEVRNPWNPGNIAGGSSGGSAAAVAAEMGYASIGTDTGGSIREPAAICGVVGLKPTYGRVSTHGVIPLSWSLDHVGPLTRTVADAAIVLQAIAGYDPQDTSSADVPVPDYLQAMRAKSPPLRIGVPRHFFYDDLDSETASAVEQALGVFRSLGAEVRDVDLKVETDRTLLGTEAYAYHADHVAKTPELYQAHTLARIRSAQNVTAAEYIQRRQALDANRRRIRAAFNDVDLLVTPTVPVITPTIRELQENPEQLRAREITLLRNTRPGDDWGLPGISVPCGFSASGLPIGLQIMGAPWEEGKVLRAAHTYEEATAWHKRRPTALA